LGAVAVIDEGKIRGVITDGDIRRMLEKKQFNADLLAKDIMGSQPKIIEGSELAVNALQMMREHNISQLLVGQDEKYIGIVHLHDLLKEGII
jgi:arabinose-5-phosphate isomerase